MADHKHLPKTQLVIPRLVTPRHRPSLLGTVGALTRDIIESLRGPKSIALGLFISLLALSGHRYLLAQTATATDSEHSPQETLNKFSPPDGHSSRVQQVTLQTAQIATVNNTLTFTGTVVPENLLRIAPSLSSVKILEMRSQPGDRVTAGQIIAVLDNSILLSQLAQAEAQLAQAESAVKSQQAAIAQAEVIQAAANIEAQRYTTLYEQGAISQEQLGNRQIQTFTTRQNVDVALAALSSAQANVASHLAAIEQIKTQIEQTVVVAPATGTIAENLATVGEIAAASTPVYTLIEEGELVLQIKPSQTQLGKIKLNSPVEIRSISQQNQLSLTGSVKTIEPSLEAASRQAIVEIAFPHTASALRPGMFLQANIITNRSRSVLVPAAAIITQGNEESIVYTAKEQNNGSYTVEANTVQTASLSANSTLEVENNATPIDRSRYVQILSGLEAGSQVIVSGASYLQPGDAVTVSSTLSNP